MGRRSKTLNKMVEELARKLGLSGYDAVSRVVAKTKEIAYRTVTTLNAFMAMKGYHIRYGMSKSHAEVMTCR